MPRSRPGALAQHPRICYNCRAPGHKSRDCPEPPRPRAQQRVVPPCPPAQQAVRTAMHRLIASTIEEAAGPPPAQQQQQQRRKKKKFARAQQPPPSPKKPMAQHPLTPLGSASYRGALGAAIPLVAGPAAPHAGPQAQHNRPSSAAYAQQNPAGSPARVPLPLALAQQMGRRRAASAPAQPKVSSNEENIVTSIEEDEEMD